LIFIDEIDAVGRQPVVPDRRRQRRAEQTLSQLLTEMDGFEATPALSYYTTNRPDVLDSLSLATNDRQVMVDAPRLERATGNLRVPTAAKET